MYSGNYGHVPSGYNYRRSKYAPNSGYGMGYMQQQVTDYGMMHDPYMVRFKLAGTTPNFLVLQCSFLIKSHKGQFVSLCDFFQSGVSMSFGDILPLLVSCCRI